MPFLQWLHSEPGAAQGGGGQLSPYDFFFFLTAQRPVMSMMIIPLPHYENCWTIFVKSEKNVSESPARRLFQRWCSSSETSPPPPPPPTPGQANTLAPPPCSELYARGNNLLTESPGVVVCHTNSHTYTYIAYYVIFYSFKIAGSISC